MHRRTPRQVSSTPPRRTLGTSTNTPTRRPAAEEWHHAASAIHDTPAPPNPPSTSPRHLGDFPPKQQRTSKKRRNWLFAIIGAAIIMTLLVSRTACVWFQTDIPSMGNPVGTTQPSPTTSEWGTIRRSTTIPTTTPTDEASREYQRGKDLHAQGDYYGALQAYQSAQNHLGRPSVALSSRIALTKAALGDHQSAIDHYTKAIEIQDYAQARVLRAVSYRAKDQCQLAIRDAQHVLKMEPEPSQETQIYAHQTISLCHQQDGQSQMAIRHAESALTLLQDNNGDPELIRLAETNLDNIRQSAMQPSWPNSRPSPTPWPVSTFYLECPTETVLEGNSFEVYLVREPAEGQQGLNFGAWWHTDPGGADERDYVPLPGESEGIQWTTTAEQSANRQARTIHTINDDEVEGSQDFWVRFTPTDSVSNPNNPSRDERCRIWISDDDRTPTPRYTHPSPAP